MANTCGPHAELASNDAVKITRCPCGTVHITVNASGVTLRVSSETFRATTTAMKAATERLDQAQTPAMTPTGTSSIN